MSGVREGWCWEGSRLPMSISQTDGVAPDLQQKGYELQVCMCQKHNNNKRKQGITESILVDVSARDLLSSRLLCFCYV